MTLSKLIGAILIASPFVGLFVFMVHEGGWKEAVIVFASTAFIVAIICAGCWLLTQ